MVISAESESTSVLVPSSLPTPTSRSTRSVLSLLLTSSRSPNSRQVAIPERVAKILTFPDRVTHHNIEVLRAAVRNGNEVHPGANFILQGGDDGFKKFLKFGDKHAMAEKLRVGDVVERHLRDNEYVFSRETGWDAS